MSRTGTLTERMTALKRAKPFQRFAIVLRNGDRRVVAEPDGLVVTDTWVHYVLPGRDRLIHLAVEEIEAVDLVQLKPEERLMIETIKTLKHREPFSPFQIVMTSGDRYLIENSDLLALGQSEVAYYFPKSDRVAFLRIIEIAAVEKLEEKPAA